MKTCSIIVIILNVIAMVGNLIVRDWEEALSSLALVVSWALILLQEKKIKQLKGGEE